MWYLKKINTYLNLVKFSHTVFAMPFAFIGFFLALQQCNNAFSWQLMLFIVLCMVFARNAAMAFNRYTDRKFDAANPRTANREIPAKKITSNEALSFVALNSVLFIATTYFINILSFYLSLPALAAILGYSYTKRFTSFSHFFLGLALSIAPMGAYIAVCGQFALLPFLLSGAVLLWVGGFDIIYALQDIDFDKNNKLKSIPALAGFKYARLLALVVHICCIGVLFLFAFIVKPVSFFLYSGVIVFSVLVIFQHIVLAKYGLKKINMAFFTLNGIASIVLALFVCVEIVFFM